ncbi:PglL family O-oligosaccharyltransferase [Methylophaga thalassica]|uniref:PglL family O-oligosaccharyltransferase n=1 Tax=Methylophaga aminisulfidivorans TaxID=230105 RepID=UPI003A8CD3C7
MQNQSLSPSRILEILLFLLFVVSPFYITSSIGGTGFDLPFNISVWFAATLVIAYMLWHIASSDTITLPKNYLYLLMLPAGILLSAVIAGVVEPVTWLFRILYILAGVIFLFGLFQFKSLSVERVLFFIVLSGLLVSIYGVVEIHQWQAFIGDWIPRSNDTLPTTIFQQVNVTASYLVTGILIAVFLSFDKWTENKKIIQSVLFVTIALCIYVVISSGSRLGLLSLALGGLLLIIGSLESIAKRKYSSILLILISVLSVWIATADFAEKTTGLNYALDKTYQLTKANHTDIRAILYGVSIDAVKSSPLVGHGIGSFGKEWVINASNWYENYPSVENMPYTIDHPHNEILMWAVEGGAIAISGILIAIFSTAWVVIQFYGKTSLVFFALLLPISIHTQLEQPFYLSSLHWFLWLFLIYLALKHIVFDINNGLSRMAKVTLKSLALFFLFATSLFLYQTVKAQKDIANYVLDKQVEHPLQQALVNPYFQSKARDMANRSVLYHAIENGNKQKISQLLANIQMQLKNSPDLKLYEDMINGYEALSEKQQSCSIAEQALNFYPWNVGLKKYYSNCPQE